MVFWQTFFRNQSSEIPCPRQAAEQSRTGNFARELRVPRLSAGRLHGNLSAFFPLHRRIQNHLVIAQPFFDLIVHINHMPHQSPAVI